LLADVWSRAGLDGIYAPAWQPGGSIPRPALQRNVQALDDIDPFATVMVENAAAGAAALLRDRSEESFGLVLRPCELRSLEHLLEGKTLRKGRSLLISTDCPATFPQEDFVWRVHETSDRDQPTRDALHFAAQGGILPSRYRPSCQVCDHPYAEEADLLIEVLGIETGQHLVIDVRDEKLAARLGFDGEFPQLVPPDVIERRNRILQKLADWRQQSRAYADTHLLETDASPSALRNHILHCTACRERLEAQCPLFDAAWLKPAEIQVEPLRHWLLSCGGCGMCDHDCPDGYPLSSVITSLKARAEAGIL
jgi:hypothetical protein